MRLTRLSTIIRTRAAAPKFLSRSLTHTTSPAQHPSAEIQKQDSSTTIPVANDQEQLAYPGRLMLLP